MLENKLDKAMIKYNEAQSIRKTYEMIVKRLKDERVGYDNQLAAIEQSLKGKDHDLEELLLLSHDANHAKEVAMIELDKFTNQSEARRELQNHEVSKQREQVEKTVDHKERIQRQKEILEQQRIQDQQQEEKNKHIQSVNEMQEAQHRHQQEREKLIDYNNAMQRIKDNTGVTDVNEIIQKFSTQEDTLNNL